MVNLIPKPAKKISKAQRIFLYSLVFILISLTLVYVVLVSMEQRAQSKIKKLEDQITAQKTTKMIELEREIKNYKREIDEYSSYLAEHLINTKFFNLLEETVHPQVTFNQLALHSDSSYAQMSGRANSFLALGQQLIIFNNNEEIQSFNLTGLSIDEKGYVIFSLSLLLNSSLFQY